MSLLANVGNALGAAAMAVPLLTAASGLMKLLSSAVAMAAKTPLVDAAVALVPGLAAQSRVGNNPEILELRLCAPRREPEYFAITSNFEPAAPGWKFWEWFRAGRLADLGADIVFDGPNDLVVDTSAMVDLADGLKLPASQVHAYGKNGEVHHCNYFEQAATIGKLREWLAV